MGYNQAKKILYTKEDMMRMAIYCWDIASKPEYGKTYNVNEIAENYIQSLKTKSAENLSALFAKH